MIEKICQNCGATNSSQTSWCINCGGNLVNAKVVEKKISPDIPQQDLSNEHLNYKGVYHRPFVVTLFALYFAARALFGLAYILIYVPFVFFQAGYPSEIVVPIYSYFIISIIILVFYLILSYGLLTAKKWARFLVIVLIIVEIITIVIVISSPTNVNYYPNVTALIVNIVFLLLFLGGNVGHYFEKYEEYYKK